MLAGGGDFLILPVMFMRSSRCCATYSTSTVCTESTGHSSNFIIAIASQLMSTVIVGSSLILVSMTTHACLAAIAVAVLVCIFTVDRERGHKCFANTASLLMLANSCIHPSVQIACVISGSKSRDGHQADNQDDCQYQCQKFLLHLVFNLHSNFLEYVVMAD